MLKSQTNILITGCSSGIGLETAALLANSGHRVIATMRDITKAKELTDKVSIPNNLCLMSMDITKPETIVSAVKSIIEQFGTIDVLINNAGITIDGFFEDHSPEDVEWIFKTNVMGMMNVTRTVLPYMRKQKSGQIINIGSIAGRWALPAISVYSATKFAVDGFTEGLRHELMPWGIKVTVVEPCFVNTNMVTVNRNVAANTANPHSPYYVMTEQAEAFYEKYGQKYEIEPEVVAAKIKEIINTSNPKLRYMLGNREQITNLLIRILPERLANLFLKNNYPAYE